MYIGRQAISRSNRIRAAFFAGRDIRRGASVAAPGEADMTARVESLETRRRGRRRPPAHTRNLPALRLAPLPPPPPAPPNARELFGEALRELWRQMNPDLFGALS